MKSKPIATLETFAYLLVFLLAALLRFGSLGRLPLNDAEAALALQALAQAQGSPVLPSAQPGYLVLTSLLFDLFGSTAFLARFWPALAGSLLVFSPALFRRQLGRWPALALAVALALDGGLVAISRSAGGTMMAVTGTLLALGFLFQGRAVLAGISGAIGLLGGPQFWPGVLAVALALVVFRFFATYAPVPVPAAEVEHKSARRVQGGNLPFVSALIALALIAAGFFLLNAGFLFLSAGFWLAAWYAGRRGLQSAPDAERLSLEGFPWCPALVAFLLTFLAAGTLFLRAASGLSATGESLALFIRGFGAESGVSALRMLLALPLYQPVAIVFGLWRIIANLAQRNRLDAFLSILWFFSIGLALIPAAREVSALAWSLLPLWALAVRQVARLLDGAFAEYRWTTLAQAGLMFVLLIFIAQNFVALNNDITSLTEQPQVRVIAIIGAMILMVLTGVMMGVGWSWSAARVGAVLGIGLGIVLYSIAVMSSAAGFSRGSTAELYRAAPPRDAGVLMQTVHDLGLQKNGNRHILQVIVENIDSPALEWSLRDMDSFGVVSALPVGTQPEVVITRSQVTLASAGSYRGQDFTWAQEPAWELLTPREWINWLLYRKTPQTLPDLILWARGDLFYGGISTESAQP